MAPDADAEHAVVAVDRDGIITHWNSAAVELFGYEQSEALGSGLEEILSPGQAADGKDALERVLRGDRVDFATEIQTRTDQCVNISGTASPIRDAGGRVSGALAIVRRTERPASREDALLRQRDVLLQFGRRALGGEDLAFLSRAACGYATDVLGADHAVVLRPPQGVVRVGWQVSAASQADLHDPVIAAAASSAERLQQVLSGTGPVLVPDVAADSGFAAGAALAELGVATTLSVPIRPHDQPPFGVLEVLSATPRAFTPEDTSFVEVLATILAGAIQRKASEEQIRQAVLQDQLTGLSNQVLFMDRLGHALTLSARAGSRIALLVLGMPRFPTVMSTLGTAAGAELLRLMAARLRNVISDEHTLARLEGDEFAILCPVCRSEKDAIALAEQLTDACSRPFTLDGHRFAAAPSIGILVTDSAVRGAEDALRDAQAALHELKDRRTPGYRLFDPQLRSRMVDRLRIEDALRVALEKEQLRLFYQPLVDVRSGEIAGLEALLRWQHPEDGLLLPHQFLPVAEAGGLIDTIGRWVIETACRDGAQWSPAMGVPVISINVPIRQLTQPGFASDLADIAARAGADLSQIALELSESVLPDESGSLQGALSEVRRLGAAVWLDDFGTGRSSLSSLQRFEFDALKIDRSLVAGITQERDQRIVEAVLSVARALDLHVVAEGVETVEQITHLREIGCPTAQGDLFPGPIAAAAVPGLLRTGIDASLRARLLDARDFDSPPVVSAADARPPESGTPDVHLVETVTMGEAAQALGVSVSTLRRWADAGEIGMVRTAGGHRRFPIAEIRRLASRSSRSNATSIRVAEPPAGPLPALAELLGNQADHIAEFAAKGLYDGQARSGWFASEPGLAAARAWLEAVRSAAAGGDYGLAAEASRGLLQGAQAAGASVLERHSYVERVSELLVRTLASRDAPTDEIRATGRLLLSVRHAHLQAVA